MPTWPAALRAYPALLRVGFASALAYRAEFFVWILTTNLPLINLALWSAVARDQPVGRYGQAEFTAYFLAALIIRQLTGSWLVWELTMEIRQGTLAMRLLRPVNPFLAYSAENLAALPLRAAIAVPIAGIMLWVVGADRLSQDPVVWLSLPFLVFGAWLLVFLVMAIIGLLALWIESAASVFEVWLALFTVFSGYLVPLELFPEWLREIAAVLPFRLLLSLQVEAMLGHLTRAEILSGALQLVVWVALLGLVLRAMWRAGLARFGAFGG